MSEKMIEVVFQDLVQQRAREVFRLVLRVAVQASCLIRNPNLPLTVIGSFTLPSP